MSVTTAIMDSAEAPVSEARSAPLCIDLDGTLLRTDVLFESMLALFHRNPLYAFVFPLWFLRGRARQGGRTGRALWRTRVRLRGQRAP